MNQLKKFARQMKRQMLTLYFAAQHKDMPFLLKILALLIVSYAISPIDLIPDFIPLIGIIDDLILLPVGIYICYRLIPPHVLREARAMDGDIDIKHQYVIALLIISIWVIFIYFFGRAAYSYLQIHL
ncbi:YkvA family protein [Macrococcus lamae]|uniref:DUF1232 domain-containing protein n=1 Tax=Macrococcus lamae TaxID=198484 RepID=A0A4R6BUF6_9STAP|nr:YkvA family protein [Macrococcus lamae]TDM11940.1 DUF1232 domain-containing protein [Macrococcus lamae]